MPLVGEPVVDRDAGPLRELLGRLLREAAVLDRVVHAAEHARGVLHRLLVAHVRAAGADERDVGALVVGGDLERAARPRRVLLEDQRDLLADELLLLAPFALGRLQLGRQVDQVGDLLGRVVGQLHQVPAAQVDHCAHGSPPSSGVAGDRTGHAVAAAAALSELLARRWRAPRRRPSRASRSSPRCARTRRRRPAPARRRCCRRPTGCARPRTRRRRS